MSAAPAHPATRQLVSIPDAAARAGVHPATLRRWIAAGHLPGYRIGPRLLKVDLADVDNLARPLDMAEVGADE